MLQFEAKDTSPESVASTLTMPPRALHDLVIVGGGVGGLSAAEALMVSIQKERETALADDVPVGHARFKWLRRVAILTGGRSVAFAPAAGEFAEHLTLANSETLRRDVALEQLKQRVQSVFQKYDFDFRSNVFAKKISDNKDGVFLIETSVGEKPVFLKSKKLILALGHTLQQIAPDQRPYILSGAGDLCERMARLHVGGASQQTTMDTFLSQFRRAPDGYLKVGLVGFGASCLETLKIFHALLACPDGVNRNYRTIHSNTPVEFVLFDSALGRFYGTAPIDLMAYMEAGRQHSISRTGISGGDQELYHDSATMRVGNFLRSGQLRVIPRRVNFETIRVCDGVVEVPQEGDRTEMLSCVVHCAPFMTGINAKHKQVVEEIAGISLKPLDHGMWNAALSDEGYRIKLGLVGAAFHPSSCWDGRAIYQQALHVIDDFFPRLG